jgi:hypothetical protein
MAASLRVATFYDLPGILDDGVADQDYAGSRPTDAESGGLTLHRHPGHPEVRLMVEGAAIEARKARRTKMPTL